MKFLAVILSVYFLALNFAPCEDDASVCDNDTTEISQHSDSDHDHGTSDDCSPFCQCHCCHVHVVQFNPIEISFNVLDISTKQFLHFDSLGQDVNETILQPPRA